MLVKHLGNQIVRAPNQLAVRAIDHPQRSFVLEHPPALLEPRSMIRLDHEVHRGDIVGMPLDMLGAQTGVHTDNVIESWAEAGLPGLAATPPLPATTSGTVSAALGEADTMGALSVPPTWMAGTPAVRPVALALPAASVGVDQQALAGSMESAFSNMTLANAAGRAVSDTLGARGRAPPRILRPGPGAWPEKASRLPRKIRLRPPATQTRRASPVLW